MAVSMTIAITITERRLTKTTVNTFIIALVLLVRLPQQGMRIRGGWRRKSHLSCGSCDDGNGAGGSRR